MSTFAPSTFSGSWPSIPWGPPIIRTACGGYGPRVRPPHPPLPSPGAPTRPVVVVAALLTAACGDDRRWRDGTTTASSEHGDSSTGSSVPMRATTSSARRSPFPSTTTIPAARRSTSALMRLPADDDGDRIGSLLVNPGGPGVPGTDLVPAADVDLAPARSAIGSTSSVGTRGALVEVRRSTASTTSTATSPSPIRHPTRRREPGARGPGAGVRRRVRERPKATMLGHISTVDTTNDLERIRDALGEDTISYMGFSYGSELGATYATLFPKHIRAMVLDGAIDPDLDGVETARRAGDRRRARARRLSRRLLVASHVRVQQQRRRRGRVRRADGEARHRSRCRRRSGGGPRSARASRSTP